MTSEVNECTSSPCQNQAQCVDEKNSYSCTCQAGWSGTNCQTGTYHCNDVIMNPTASQNHQPHDCLLKRLFWRRSKKTSKLRVTGLCDGNSVVTGEFPTQRASNAEIFFVWRHLDMVYGGLNKMVNILQTTFSIAFSWKKYYIIWLKFHWSFILGGSIICQHWFGNEFAQATSSTERSNQSVSMISVEPYRNLLLKLTDAQ